MTTIHSLLSLLKRCALLLTALALSTISVSAHDMWIEPTAFLPDAGRIIGLRLRVGQDFLGDPLPYNSTLIDQFFGLDSTGRKPVVGHDGNDPAGLIRVAAPGMLIIGYNSNPSPMVLPAVKFNQYLQEEGLDAISELRKNRNQTNSDAREVFSRCAKSLLFSGTPADKEGDRALGFTLELIAKKNPYALRAGDDFPVDLMYQGHPLAGALVVAMNRQNPAAKMLARTDKNGRVTFRLPQGGIWLVKAVHMIPAAGTNADWASYWASLTFELKTSTTGVASR